MTARTQISNLCQDKGMAFCKVKMLRSVLLHRYSVFPCQVLELCIRRSLHRLSATMCTSLKGQQCISITSTSHHVGYCGLRHYRVSQRYQPVSPAFIRTFQCLKPSTRLANTEERHCYLFQPRHDLSTFARDQRNCLQSTPPRTSCLQSVRFYGKALATEEYPIVTATGIRHVLRKHNIPFTTGYTCFVAESPFVTKRKKTVTAAKKDFSLYINMTTGYFTCLESGVTGGWNSLQDYLEVVPKTRAKGAKAKTAANPDNGRETFSSIASLSNVKTQGQSEVADDAWKRATPIKETDTTVLSTILSNLGAKHLSHDSLDKLNVRVDVESGSLVFPWFHHHDNRICGVKTIQGRRTGKNQIEYQEWSVPKCGYYNLFGCQLGSADTDEVILTASELDVIALRQGLRNSKRNTMLLALPKGTASLPQEILPFLEKYRKVILWFGNDMRSWEASKQFSRKLNTKRCFFIRPKEEHPRPLDFLLLGSSMGQVVSEAQPVNHKSIVSFSELREDVHRELSQAEQVAGVKWKRFPQLNKLLKGFRRGELTVFTGPTGSGKTTFISEYSLDSCMQGVNTLWGSFEIQNVRLLKMMLSQFSQLKLEANLDNFDEWADRFEALPLYFMTFYGQQTLKNVTETMQHAAYVYDIEHVIVDNLQFMMGTDATIGVDRFRQQDAIIATFRKFASANNCHVTLVIHPRKEEDTNVLQMASVFGSAKATQEADNVMILQDKRLSTQQGKKFLQIVKNRFDGELGVMPLSFNKDTLCMSTPRTPRRKKVELEKQPVESSLNEDSTVLPLV
ncbi:twinkle protein, mitochondrial-like [Branchiostoma floridae]|uniref:DNA 5'-3' helicase n=2 Tax=Branchiostoma floridae TaxID=7739 RepID=A0A9J7HQX3_BRAFL|nr:twinkle protein, mitochondrial-like [Branchiostoma floridae]